MAVCRWCDKSLPGTAIPACGKCFYKSRVDCDPEKDNEPSKVVVSDQTSNYDLSYLKREPEVQYTKGKSKDSIRHSLYTETIFGELTSTKQEIPMSTVKVKSNSLRDRSIIVDNLVLSFDENGVAEIDEAYADVVRAYSRVRPGRLTLVVPEPEPAPAPVEKKPAPPAPPVEEKVEEKVEPKKATKSGTSKKAKVEPKEDDQSKED